MCQLDMVPNVGLELFHPVNSKHEPDFQRAEPSTQWNLPVLENTKYEIAQNHNRICLGDLKLGIFRIEKLPGSQVPFPACHASGRMDPN